MRRAIALAAVLLVVLPAPALAHRTEAAERSRQQGIDAEIDRLEGEIGELSAEEHELSHRLERARATRLALDGQLATLARDIIAVESDLEAATTRLSTAQADLAVARRRLMLARRRVEDARAQVRDRAIAAYVSNTGAELADAVFETSNLRELGARTAYAQAVVQRHVRAVEGLHVAQKDAVAVRAEQGAALAKATEARDAIAVQHLELEERRHAQSKLRADAHVQEREEASLLEAVQSHLVAHEDKIAALRRESDAIGSFLRSIQAGQGVTITGSGQLSHPVPGARLSSTFGPRVHPIFGTTRLHSGVDFAASAGTPVRAAATGRVVHAGERGGYGNAVIIDHGGSLATLYAHLSVVAVAPGSSVERGQVIGAVGSTGFSTGPHLHFEVRVAGTPVDPLPYLRLRCERIGQLTALDT